MQHLVGAVENKMMRLKGLFLLTVKICSKLLPLKPNLVRRQLASADCPADRIMNAYWVSNTFRRRGLH